MRIATFSVTLIAWTLLAATAARSDQPAIKHRVNRVELVRAGEQTWGTFTHSIEPFEHSVEIEVHTNDPAALLASLVTSADIRVKLRSDDQLPGTTREEFGSLAIGDAISHGRGQKAKLALRYGEVLYQTEGLLFGLNENYVQLLRGDPPVSLLEQHRRANIESVQLDSTLARAAAAQVELLRNEMTRHTLVVSRSSSGMAPATIRYTVPSPTWSVRYHLQGAANPTSWKISSRTTLQNACPAEWSDATVILRRNGIQYAIEHVYLALGSSLDVVVVEPRAITVKDQYTINLAASSSELSVKHGVQVINDLANVPNLLRGPVVVERDGYTKIQSEFTTELYNAPQQSGSPAPGTSVVLDGGKLDDVAVTANVSVKSVKLLPSTLDDGLLRIRADRTFSLTIVNRSNRVGKVELKGPVDQGWQPTSLSPIDLPESGELVWVQSRVVKRSLQELKTAEIELLPVPKQTIDEILKLGQDVTKLRESLIEISESLQALRHEWQSLDASTPSRRSRVLLTRIGGLERQMRIKSRELDAITHHIARVVGTAAPVATPTGGRSSSPAGRSGL